MKKSLLLILILFSVSNVLAIQTTLKPEYSQGETLIAEFSGNFLEDIQPDDILFYSGRLYTPMLYDFIKVQEKYYLYSILPFKERDYTLVIKEAKFLELGQETIQDLQFNFSVKNSTAVFNVNPGFILTNKDFSLKINSISPITIQSEFLNSSENIEVSKEKTISYSISSLSNFSLNYVKLSSGDTTYRIPIAVFKNSSSSQVKKTSSLRFLKFNQDFNVIENQPVMFEIFIVNTGQTNLSDVILVSNIPEITINQEAISLNSGDMGSFNITINSEEIGTKNAIISAVSENISTEIDISLRTLENTPDSIAIIKNTSGTTLPSCASINGQFCQSGEKCKGTKKPTIDSVTDYCCVGGCKKSSGWGTYIFIFIIIVVLAVIAFFVLKRMKQRKTSSSDIIKTRGKEFEDRFKPIETKDSLSRN